MLETVEATAEMFTSHTADKNNPHNVTKEQVGLSNVDNTADMDKPVSNAVNSAINTFKEENSKEHTKIHSAINTFKEESEITFTEINNVIEALQTNIQQAEQLISSLRDETNTALANKADSNHNHDSTYSKTSHTHTGYAAKSHTHSNYSTTNHTHTGYAASSHNHDSVYFKKANILPVTSGGNGNNKGLSQGLTRSVIIQENNWLSDNTQGVFPLFWQTSDFASKKLPYTAGALIKASFTEDRKTALAFDLGDAGVSVFELKSNKWKPLAFNENVINKMPKVSKTSGVGHLQQVAGQGVPVTYRLPPDGTYFYFLTCTNDYNNYSAVDNITGIAEGGTEILPASINKKTFGGFIWRIQ